MVMFNGWKREVCRWFHCMHGEKNQQLGRSLYKYWHAINGHGRRHEWKSFIKEHSLGPFLPIEAEQANYDEGKLR